MFQKLLNKFYNTFYNTLVNKLTKNKTKILLLFIYFDHVKFKATGKVGSCTTSIHPVLANDELLKRQINTVIDGIRERYDMEDVV
jgi:hypothetical protein